MKFRISEGKQLLINESYLLYHLTSRCHVKAIFKGWSDVGLANFELPVPFRIYEGWEFQFIERMKNGDEE